MTAALLCMAALAGLSACGKGSGGASGGGATAILGGPKWNEADACKTVTNKAVQAAAGEAIKESKGDSMSAKPAGGAAVSTCSYTFASGASMVVMTRVVDTDITDTEIDQMRTGGGMMEAGEEVPGLGMKAFWSPKAKQLQLHVDRKHYAGIVYGPPLTMPGAPAPTVADPKTVATTLAKSLL